MSFNNNRSFSDWESGNDSALLASLNRVENQRNLEDPVLDEEVETDIDDDNVNSKDQWESMDNSQFINYVNQMSSFHQVSKSQRSQQSQSGSSLFGAQKPNSSVYSNPDVITEQDEQKAKEYAFADHETYFATKRDKQALQDEEYLKLTDNDKSEIFLNCSIHINGRTDPDIMTLRKLIVINGGKFVHHLKNKSSATHIVAEHLPPKKRHEFANCKVVRPAWIMDSIKNGKILNWALYRIDGLNPFGQKQIIPTNQGIKLGDKLTTNNDITLELDDEGYDDAEKGKKELDEIGNVFENTSKAIDAKHPDFLNQFFAKSRLHYLSRWKAELRSKFLNKAVSVLKEREVKESPGKVILHVDFDCFFATVSAIKSGIDINKVPVCVTHGGGSADIASCNYVSRSFGVVNGMWLSSARKKCPDLTCLPYEFDDYQVKSTLFYDFLLKLKIDSILPVSIDEALVDISTLAETESIEQIIRRVKTGLDEITGCSVSCGAGSNVLLAKLALRKAKPNGVYYIRDSNVLEEISDIQFDKLPGIGYKLFNKLCNHMGKSSITLEDVRSLPRGELVGIFGVKTGEMILNYCIGKDSTSIDIINGEYARKSVGIDINWGIRFEDDLQVEGFLNRLAVELNKRLLEIAMKGSNLTLKLATRHPNAPIEPAKYLGMGKCNFTSKISKLGVVTREISVLASEMRYIWRYMNIKPVELRGVSVHMNGLISDDEMKEDVNQMKLNFKKLDPPIKNQNARIQSPKKKDPLMNAKPKLERISQPVALKEQEIDWEVFQFLPMDIQKEIKEELRRRSLKASPKKRKVFDNERDIAILVSPKRREQQKRNPVDIVNEYKIPKRNDVQVVFQGSSIDNLELIKEKVFKWLVLTIEDGSMNEDDLLMFNNFMSELIISKHYSVFLNIIEWIRVLVDNRCDKQGFGKWDSIINSLNGMFKQQSYIEMEFIF